MSVFKLFLLYCLTSFFTSNVDARVPNECKKIGIVANWPPLTVFDAQGAGGLDVEIVRSIFEHANMCYQFVRLPSSARTFEEMQKGTIDVSAMTSYTEQREKFGSFSIRYRDESMRLISIAKPQHINKLDEILVGNKTIGLSIGSYYGEEVSRLMSDTSYHEQFVGLASANSRIAMLMKGRVDFIIDDMISAHYYKTKLGHKNLQLWPYIVHDNPVYLLLSHTAFSVKEVAIINVSIQYLEKEINEIVRRYQNE